MEVTFLSHINPLWGKTGATERSEKRERTTFIAQSSQWIPSICVLNTCHLPSINLRSYAHTHLTQVTVSHVGWKGGGKKSWPHCCYSSSMLDHQKCFSIPTTAQSLPAVKEEVKQTGETCHKVNLNTGKLSCPPAVGWGGVRSSRAKKRDMKTWHALDLAVQKQYTPLAFPRLPFSTLSSLQLMLKAHCPSQHSLDVWSHGDNSLHCEEKRQWPPCLQPSPLLFSTLCDMGMPLNHAKSALKC